MDQSVKIELVSTDTKVVYVVTESHLMISEIYEKVNFMKQVFFDGVSPVRISVEVRENGVREED